MRPIALAAALAAIAACDSAPYPEPTNPYDPAYPGARRVSAPASMTVEDATSTSVTLMWDDPSTFETGFRVEQAEVSEAPGAGPLVFEPVATLPPDVTAYEVTGLYGTSPLAFRVVTLGERGDKSLPSPEVRVRYPDGARVVPEPYRFTTGLISYSGRTAFFGVWDVPGYTSVIAVPGAERVAEVGGVETLVGRFGADGAVSIRVGEYDRGSDYAVLERGEVVERGTLELPGEGWSLRTEWLGRPTATAISADGRRFVGTWAGGSDGQTQEVWDLTTGRLVAHGLRGIGGTPQLLGVTAGGRLLYVTDEPPAAPELRAMDVATGVQVWSRPVSRSVRALPALDLSAGRILVADGVEFHLLDAETGGVVGRLDPGFPAAFQAVRLSLQGSRAVACGPSALAEGHPPPVEVCHVVEVPSGRRLRSVTVGRWVEGYTPYTPAAPDMGATPDTFVFIRDHVLTTVPLDGTWEPIP